MNLTLSHQLHQFFIIISQLDNCNQINNSNFNLNVTEKIFIMKKKVIVLKMI